MNKTYNLILPCDSKGYVWNNQELDEKCAKITLSMALGQIKKDEISLEIVKNNAYIIQQLIEGSDELGTRNITEKKSRCNSRN